MLELLLLLLLFKLLLNLPDNDEVDTLNSKLELDFLHSYRSLYNDNSPFDPPANDPYLMNNTNCLFYKEDSFFDTFSSFKESLVLNANIQSLASKFSDLRDFVFTLGSKNVPIEIISLQEIWSVPDVNLFNLPGYQELVFKSRKSCKGGGIGFFIKKGLTFAVQNDLSSFHERIFESLCIDVDFKHGKKIRFVNIYRPPGNHPVLDKSDQLNAFFVEFLGLISKLSKDNIESYILMDSNINLLDMSCNPVSSNLVDLCLSNGFFNLISKATRITHHSFSLIDQIFTNSNSTKFQSGVLLTDISDHFFTFSSLCISKSVPKPKLKTSRNFNDESMNSFKVNLSSLNWDDLLHFQDAELAFNSFWETFKSLFDMHFPVKKVYFNKNVHKIQGFMTNGLLKSRRTKLKLFNFYISNPSEASLAEYRQYRNIYNNLIRTSKRMYFEQNLDMHKNNPKKMWKFLNESVNRVVNRSNTMEKVSVEGNTISDSPKIANAFNNFFSQIPTKIRNNIPNTQVSALSFLTNTESIFELEPCDHFLIEEILNSLETKGTLDIDDISSSFLKKIASLISTPLAFIFNLSFSTGVFPSRLKVSRTVPIFKAGCKDVLNNYRPISCLPILSKVIEKIASKRLYNYLNINNLLYSHQYGFQYGKSTSLPIFHIVDYISKALNNNEFAVGVFLDLQKAFDVVDHGLLILKLKSLGVQGSSLKWFENYLKDRKQFVMINGKFSESFKIINVGVPQGSILGPLLFLCFINDFHKSNSFFNVLFADDTTALCKGHDLNILCNFVNLELQKLGTWLRANKLAINTEKTKVMIFHARGRIVPDVTFKFDNNDVDCVSNSDLIVPLERISNKCKTPAFKILGVYLDENLSFDYHFKITKSKIAKSLFSLKNAKNILPAYALKSLYFALIHPYFLYCLPIISSTSQSNINLLYKQQKIAIRLISKSKFNAHTQPLFFSLSILPLPELIIHQRLIFMHSYVFSLLPPSFNGMFSTNRFLNGELYNMRNMDDFFVPGVRTENLKRFPLYTFPTAWNSLSAEFKSINQRIMFKSSLKADLLGRLEYFQCIKLFCKSCFNF